ncbi:hypothetical protein ACFYM2_05460 [Streptomyces sp. NPDC006711]|uniref:hypothetical protein n=1 Tax=Streptomyces sp. NPDC006711 TaxID=3364762 RepID=UPI0036A7997F
MEDNDRTGGAGWAAGRPCGTPAWTRRRAVSASPRRFPLHAWRGEVPADTGLTPVGIAGSIGAALAAMEDAATAARKENDA